MKQMAAKLCNLQQLKIAVFAYRSPHFCYPQRRPCDYHAICCMDGIKMERQFNACQTPRIMYLSIFNSFRVIRCLSQCVVQKSLFLPHFGFPSERPWGNHAKCCMDGKRIRCLQIVSLHVPIYLQQFPSYSNCKCKKIAIFTYRSPHFCFPWRRPCDHHAICCMDGKAIQCLPNPSQHVPIYLQ